MTTHILVSSTWTPTPLVFLEGMVVAVMFLQRGTADSVVVGERTRHPVQLSHESSPG
jgi:hypothetical protein